MINWTLYETRLTLDGNTQRDRLINKEKYQISHNIINHPSYKTVLINEVSDGIIIINTDDSKTKNYNAMPNKTYPIGSLIDYANGKWLITDINADSEVYQTGIIKQCNHLLRFQNNTSTIVECWGILEKPQASLTESREVTVLSSKLKLTLPYNNDTRKIHIDKRLFIETRFDENGKEIAVVYKVNNIINSISDYGNGKLLEITLEEVGSSTSDSLTEKIADYIAPDTPSVPQTPDPVLLNCVITGSSYIKSGGSARSYEAKFYKEDGATLDTTITPVWQLICLPEHTQYYTTQSNGNFISISAADNSGIIGTEIKLILTDIGGLYNPTEFIVKVVSAF